MCYFPWKSGRERVRERQCFCWINTHYKIPLPAVSESSAFPKFCEKAGFRALLNRWDSFLLNCVRRQLLRLLCTNLWKHYKSKKCSHISDENWLCPFTPDLPKNITLQKMKWKREEKTHTLFWKTWVYKWSRGRYKGTATAAYRCSTWTGHYHRILNWPGQEAFS